MPDLSLLFARFVSYFKKRRSPPTDVEIPLSNWRRSICESIEYPAFGDPEPVVLPDMSMERVLNFSGFTCYETTFAIENPKSLLLEILDASGSVEVFINGETVGLKIKPPYRYDLSGFARQGKNYLAIEVAVTIEQGRMVIMADQPGKMQHDGTVIQPCVIGNVRLYTNE